MWFDYCGLLCVVECVCVLFEMVENVGVFVE